MRHIDVATYGLATAVLIVVILLAPFGARSKGLKESASPSIAR
jgi:hypothetical protein